MASSVSYDDEEKCKRPHLPLRRRLQLLLSSDASITLSTLPSDRTLALVFALLVLSFYLFLGLGLNRLLAYRSEKEVLHRLNGVGTQARNWGDYVALGLARDKMLIDTPVPYNHLGERGIEGFSRELYSDWNAAPLSDLARAGATGGEEDSAIDDDADSSRRGVLGGESVQWSTGVVGVGNFLGESVDMRKRADDGSLEGLVVTTGRSLVEHILEKGWLYEDAEDEASTIAMLAKAKLAHSFEGIPLRDRVRGDLEAQNAAALGWSRIYSAFEGNRLKSALEVSIEKLVRRVPVVIFSKTNCPSAKRAKEFFEKVRLPPGLPHIIEVDMRPDGANLKGLLERKTGHGTFPNIVIGGRSIGGYDDLKLLYQSGKISILLSKLGIPSANR